MSLPPTNFEPGADARKDGPGASLLALAAAVGIFFIGLSLYMTGHDWESLFGRDLRVYQAAIDAFAAGEDPYGQARHAHGLIFTSPPFVWGLYKLIAHSGFRPMFGTALLVADGVSIAALPLILSWLLLGPGLARAALGAAFFFAAFAGSGFFTAAVINNGTPLYAMIAAGLILGMTRGRWLMFHVAVALATAFKPFYAAFWLVPLLADGMQAREWAASAAGLGAAALTYLAPALLAPKLFAAWLHTLLKQTVGEGLLGDNLLGAMLTGPGRHAAGAAYAAQGVFSLVLLVASLCLARFDRPRRIAALVLIAVFLNPRAQRYDISTAAIPLLAVCAVVIFARAPGIAVQALWAAALAAVMFVFSHNTAGDGALNAGIVLAALLGSIAAESLQPSRA